MSPFAKKPVESCVVSTNSTSQFVIPEVPIPSLNSTLTPDRTFPVGDRRSFPEFTSNALKTPPLAATELQQLIIDLRDKHMFRGTDTILPDGTPLVLLAAPNARTFKALQQQATVAIWCWPTPFGKLMSVSAWSDGKLLPARTFMPMDHPIYHAARATRKIAFALHHEGKVSKFHLVDFNTDLQRYKGLAALNNLHPHPTYYYDAFDLAYWWLMAQPDMRWAEQLAKHPKDRLQAGWASWAYRMVRIFSDRLAQRRQDRATCTLPAPIDEKQFSEIFPYVHRLFQAIDTEQPLETILAIAGESLQSSDAADDMFRGIAAAIKTDYGDESLPYDALLALRTSVLVHPSVHAGLRRPWFDTRGHHLTPRHLVLDPMALGAAADVYWRHADLDEPFDHGLIISGCDIPVDPQDVTDSLSTLQLHECTLEETQIIIQSLLAEAAQHRQWTVPWGARVQLRLGMFQYVDIYEVAPEFNCLLRDAHERYFLARVNLELGIVTVPRLVSKIDDVFHQYDEAMATIGVILATIIRDFLVAENRQQVFAQRPRKLLGMAARTIHPGLAVTYIPRVRYEKAIDVRLIARTFAGFKPMAAHDVSGHLRRSSQASATQLALAHRDGINVPAGFTYVRPHRRGLENCQESRREYRSRSALRTLFTGVDSGGQSKVEWFDFERNVTRLVKSLGLSIEQVTGASSRNGGMNVFALNAATNELWAIRCIYCAPWRTVGPDVVVEVADSLHHYPPGTKGMIVATSGFTRDAVVEAAHHGFTLVDGAQFAAQVAAH